MSMSDEVVKIVIPSMSRADSVTTTAIFPEAVLCVPESQVASYIEWNDCQVVGHPDDVIGMAAKRQWIIEKWGDVFMVDDDLKGMKRNYLNPADPSGEDLWVDANTAYALVQTLADTARQLEARLFGYTNIQNPLHYQPQRPFKLEGILQGGWMGILAKQPGCRLSFEDCIGTLNEDDFISLLNKHHHRYCLIDQRYSFVEKQQPKGGLVGQKTEDNNSEALAFLVEKFGRKEALGIYGGRGKNGR